VNALSDQEEQMPRPLASVDQGAGIFAREFCLSCLFASSSASSGFNRPWKAENQGDDEDVSQIEDVLNSSRTATVLRNPELYQLAHQSAGQGLLCREPDSTLARIVVFKFVLHGLYHGTGVEGAVVRRGTIGYKQFPLQAKSWQIGS